MNIPIHILGKDYVPLAAVPYITNQFLSTNTLASMISDAEAYCDANYDTVLSAFLVKGNGQVVYIPHQCFIDSDSASRCDIVVEREAIQRMFQMLVHELGLNRKLAGSLPTWDLGAILPSALSAAITTNIAAPVARVSQRSNSKLNKLQLLQTAVSRLQTLGAQHGVVIDPNYVPGRKKDFLAILVQLDNRVVMSESTFDCHYAKALGLHWVQGSKPRDAMPLLGLVGLTLAS